MTRLLRKRRKMISNEIIGYFIPYIVCLVAALSGVLWYARKYGNKRRELDKFRKKYSRELHHRKSSEVRLGKIGENLAPFTKEWPWDANNFRFLGNPVDGIQFNEDEIVFVEIKTGGARLSKSQKNFRDIVKAGKVKFVTFKITDNGTKLLWEPQIIDKP